MKIRFKKIFIIVLCFVVVNFITIAKVKATNLDDETRQLLLDDGWTEEEINALLEDSDDDDNDDDGNNYDNDDYDDGDNYDGDDYDGDDYDDNYDGEDDEDETKSKEELVYAGFNNYYLLFIIPLGLIIFFFTKYRKYKDIK